MAEITGKTLTNYEQYERIQVRVTRYNEDQSNYEAIQLAAHTLMKDLVEFDPPIEEDGTNVQIRFSGFDVVAEYCRSTPTTKMPKEYTADGFPYQWSPEYLLVGDGIEG